MKQFEIVDGVAVQNLRMLYRLNRAQTARMCGLTEQQITELENGGVTSFGTSAIKMQAALKLAKTLSGERLDGLPNANVFKGNSTHRSAKTGALPFPDLKPIKYQYRTNPKDLIIVAAVVSFLFLIVAIPVMRMGNPVHQKGDFVLPRTWRP
jgi:transcriptional regulator with XRE-family HTH domain